MIFIYGEVGMCARREAFLFNERNTKRDVKLGWWIIKKTTSTE